MAGESGRATARTGRVRAEQLLRRPDASDPDAVGSGEATADALRSLPSDEWRVFHDVHWPGQRDSNLDHVLVGPSGVFVVDSLTWSGDIEVEGGVLRQNGRKRDRYAAAVAHAARTVGELVPALGAKAVKPVLCFAREEPVFGWSQDVMVCSTANVTTFLESRPRVLGDTQRQELAAVLSRSLEAAGASVHSTYQTPLAVGAGPVGATSSRMPRRRVRRRKLPEPVRVIAVIGALVLAAALAFQFDLPARVGDLGSQAAGRVISPTEPIGTTVSVPASGARPSLTVTAGRPVATRSTTPGVRVQRGHRLVAVPIIVRNTDDKPWVSRSNLGSVAVDQAGSSYSNDPAYTKVRHGRALPASLRVAPGKTRRGLVVFEVPRGSQVAKVQLRVGPSLPKTVRWSLDAQG